MPFLDHLEELRWRIVKSLAAVAITFSAAFWLAWTHADAILKVLVEPIRALLPDGHLVYTHPMGLFTIIMQMSGVMALVLASPVVGYQVWAFLSPALTKRERNVIVPVLGFGVLLFLAGVLLAVKVFVPITTTLLTTVKTDTVVPLITAGDYFGFIFFICLAFGAVFELPILVLVLTALGIITPSTLTKLRRHAIVISLIVCEIVTPGDLIISTLILWVPVYGLYELSIVVSWFVHRARRKREAASEPGGAGAVG